MKPCKNKRDLNAAAVAEEMAWDRAKEQGLTDSQADAMAEMAWDAELEKQALAKEEY